jgi:hypothetical protein
VVKAVKVELRLPQQIDADGTICLFDLGMYEAGDIRIGKPHLCRPSAKYPDNTAAAIANGGAVAKGGLALDGRPGHLVIIVSYTWSFTQHRAAALARRSGVSCCRL